MDDFLDFFLDDFFLREDFLDFFLDDFFDFFFDDFFDFFLDDFFLREDFLDDFFLDDFFVLPPPDLSRRFWTVMAFNTADTSSAWSAALYAVIPGTLYFLATAFSCVIFKSFKSRFVSYVDILFYTINYLIHFIIQYWLEL